MPLFIQRQQVERSGARRLLDGFATQFNVQTYLATLCGRCDIEQVGHELAMALRQTFDAQVQQIEAARQEASLWQQKLQIQWSETNRLCQEQAALLQKERGMTETLTLAQRQLAQAKLQVTQLEDSLARECAGRAGDIDRLKIKIADLNRIVAAQQVEILKLRGEDTDDEAARDHNQPP